MDAYATLPVYFQEGMVSQWQEMSAATPKLKLQPQS